MKAEDLKIDVIGPVRHEVDVCHIPDVFVKIEHTPSGITVTKHSRKGSVYAKDRAMEELEMLVEIWKR